MASSAIPFIVTFYITMLFLLGKRDRSDAKKFDYNAFYIFLSGVQFVAFIATAILFMSRNTMLLER